MSKCSFLCVLFNKTCKESETISTFLTNNEEYFDGYFELNIWDNSTEKSISDYNSKYCNDVKLNYYTSNKNESLSKVYNYFLDDDENDFLILLDDDSLLSLDYFNEIFYLVNNIDFYVAVPKIKSPIGGLYSPAKFGLVKGSHFLNISNEFHYDLVAITSGMLVNRKKIKKEGVRFDENLSLYGIDTDFFLNLGKRNIPTYVMDLCMEHDLSYFKSEAISVKRKRFINHLSALVYISRKRGWFFFFLTLLYIPLVFLKNYKLFLTD